MTIIVRFFLLIPVLVVAVTFALTSPAAALGRTRMSVEVARSDRI
jgi:hypothetical protein